MIDFSRWIVSVDIPDWDEYFLEIVEVVKKRSKDANTQHGCILVDERNRIIATGYNSFPSNFPDDYLPNARSQTIEPNCPKYPLMVHSEPNAIANITTKNYETLTCYITGTPCTRCLSELYQNGVRRIVMSQPYGWQFSEEEKEYFDIIVYYGNISIETLDKKYVLHTEDNPEFCGRWVAKCSPC
jgi:dCMP deaminase